MSRKITVKNLTEAKNKMKRLTTYTGDPKPVRYEQVMPKGRIPKSIVIYKFFGPRGAHLGTYKPAKKMLFVK